MLFGSVKEGEGVTVYISLPREIINFGCFCYFFLIPTQLLSLNLNFQIKFIDAKMRKLVNFI